MRPVLELGQQLEQDRYGRWLLLHRSTSITFDVHSQLQSWTSIDIPKLCAFLKNAKRSLRPPAFNRSVDVYRAAGALQSYAPAQLPPWFGNRTHFSILRAHLAHRGSVGEETMWLPDDEFNEPEDIDLTVFWTTDRFFYMAYNTYLSGAGTPRALTGAFLFALPRAVLDELGTFDPTTKRFQLHDSVNCFPGVQNMNRVWGTLTFAYGMDAIETGMYRVALHDESSLDHYSRVRFDSYVNVGELENCLKEGRLIPYRQLLVSHLTNRMQERSHHSANQGDMYTPTELQKKLHHLINHPEPCSPRDKEAITAHLSHLSPSEFEPYDYQLANVVWMSDIERSIDENRWALTVHAQPGSVGGGDKGFNRAVQITSAVTFLPDKQCFVPTAEANAARPPPAGITTYPLRGGALFDAAGLGKTFVSVLLSVFRGPRREQVANPTIFSHYGGTLIVTPAQVG